MLARTGPLASRIDEHTIDSRLLAGNPLGDPHPRPLWVQLPPGYVDAWTAYGGSQFVDSPGTGAYHYYLCDEVVPFVDARYRTPADREHRLAADSPSCRSAVLK